MAVEELDPRSDGRVLKLAELLRDAASEELQFGRLHGTADEH